VAYHSRRTVATLDGLCALTLVVRRCANPACPLHRRAYRPEEEGRWALPQAEFGLDVVALVGALRFAEHRSVPEIHRALRARGLAVAERSVTNLLHRYEELVALRLADRGRLRERLAEQGRVVLALDGLQPDVGHEVLWVLRDCLSGEVLLARSLLGATEGDVAGLLREVRDALPIPVGGVVSDGQESVRKAVAAVLPGVPHQLCQFHYLREAAKPVHEADRHAKKLLKKEVRGVRPLERARGPGRPRGGRGPRLLPGGAQRPVELTRPGGHQRLGDGVLGKVSGVGSENAPAVPGGVQGRGGAAGAELGPAAAADGGGPGGVGGGAAGVAQAGRDRHG
jgi:hypothetical protein